jgi:HSP20 family protein
MNSIAQATQSEANVPQESAERQPRQRTYVAPRVDVHETKDAYVVIADVPGVSQSTLEITLEKDQLTVEGRVEPQPRESHKLRLAESSAGGFLRSFGLPEGIDRENITATVKNGVLSLTLPKSEAVRPRKITVQPSA